LKPGSHDVHPAVVVHPIDDAQLVRVHARHERPSKEYVVPLTQAVQPPATSGWYPALHLVHPMFVAQNAADEHWLSQATQVTPSREN
jgi:hypothetical protein